MNTRDWIRWTCDCRLVVTDPGTLEEAGRIADGYLDEVESAASRFRDDSELMTLRAGWNDISPVLADLVAEALSAAWLSQGSVDPTLRGALTSIGYVDSWQPGYRPTAGLRVVPTMSGWRSLKLEGNRLYRPETVQLDLGATAKAVAADRIAAKVHAELGTGVLVSLGGDIATAGETPPDGWQVTVQDLPADPPEQISLFAGAAIATSSTVRRTWTQNGIHRHHIIDPTTAAPVVSPWRTVTVVAPTCAMANTASTGAIVKGSDGVDWLRDLALPARLVAQNGRIVRLNSFPVEDAA